MVSFNIALYAHKTECDAIWHTFRDELVDVKNAARYCVQRGPGAQRQVKQAFGSVEEVNLTSFAPMDIWC